MNAHPLTYSLCDAATLSNQLKRPNSIGSTTVVLYEWLGELNMTSWHINERAIIMALMMMPAVARPLPRSPLVLI